MSVNSTIEVAHIRGFHAHVYFDQHSEKQAESLIGATTQRFHVQVGRMHRRPVGPHPMWSCQLSFERVEAGDLIAWLALNRQQLIVFIHPLTGDELRDHKDAAIWLGEPQPLDLSIFD
ncbi:MAG: DOPA 4,5-dioxygenase family protein [Marinobacterium sp.]|nr:DOPA 4,5-dioxygenase family protein [Marinobacterium sp.]